MNDNSSRAGCLEEVRKQPHLRIKSRPHRMKLSKVDQKNFPPSQKFYEQLSKKSIKLKKQFKSNKINILKKAPNQKEMKTFDIIIFAVKPQNANDVLNEYENFELKKNVLIGSIIAGKKINFFKKRIKNTNQFVRIMPNMPALIRNGISCFVSRSKLSLSNKKKLNELFLQVGKTLWLKSENQIDKATAVSGSGPGYIFTLIHAFEKAAQKLGFSKSQSRDLISSTMLGSILLMQETRKEPNQLAKEIAVKGGTTDQKTI